MKRARSAKATSKADNKTKTSSAAIARPLNLDVLLKVSKKRRDELGFKKNLLETIFECLLRSMYVYSCRVAFPELSVMLYERVGFGSLFTIYFQLRYFVKNCALSDECMRRSRSWPKSANKSIGWSRDGNQWMNWI